MLQDNNLELNILEISEIQNGIQRFFCCPLDLPRQKESYGILVKRSVLQLNSLNGCVMSPSQNRDVKKINLLLLVMRGLEDSPF